MSVLRIGSSARATLVGGAIATSLLLALGAYQQGGSNTLRVNNDPHPDFVVRITEGTPYTVPAGSMLSVKSLGLRDNSFAGGSPVVLKINGAAVIMGQPSPDPTEIPIPIVAAPGDVVTVEDAFNDAQIFGVALGYLTRI